MPGRSIGTVFAELDLDPSRYVKSQQRLYKDATRTTLNIEANFKKLGIKSSAEMDLMRAKITNSFNAIKNSGKATANDILRAEKAKNAQLKALNEQQYGHQTSILSKLRSHWMAASLAIGVVIGATAKFTQALFAQENAELKLAVAMNNAGNYTKENFRAMKDYAAQLQQVTKYGDEVTMATMANLQTYGMNTEELKKATQATLDMAAAKGIDLKAASELVGKAFVGETGTLSRYGIVLDKGIPKTEKFAAVLELIQQRFGGTAQAELETYGGQWQKISNWWGDIIEKGGLGLMKILEGLQFAVGMLAAGFYGLLEGITKGLINVVTYAEKIPMIGKKFAGMREGLENIAEGFEKPKEAALEFADTNLTMLMNFDRVERFAEKSFKQIADSSKKASQEEIEAAKKAEDKRKQAIKSITDATQKSTLEISTLGKNQVEKELILLEDKVKEYKDAGVDEITITKYVKNEKIKIYYDEAVRQKKIRDEESKDNLKRLQDEIRERKKKADEERKMTERLAKDRADAYRDMYNDLKGNTRQYYDYQLRALQNERNKYYEVTKDKALTDQWYMNEKKKLDRELILSSNDFVAGVKIGHEEMLESQMTWAKVGLQTYKDFTSEAKDSFSEFINPLKEDFMDLRSLWDKMLEGMVNSLAESVSEMGVDYATKLVQNVSPDWLFEGAGLVWEKLFKHEGEKNVGKELQSTDVPRILQAGEAVVPKGPAERIRVAMGADYDFSDMARAVEAVYGQNNAFITGAQDSFKGFLVNAAKSIVTGQLSPADLAKATPVAIISSLFSGGVNAVNTMLGFTSDQAQWGGKGGTLLSSLLFGPLAGYVGNVGGSALAELIADAFNARTWQGVKGLEASADAWENLVSRGDASKVMDTIAQLSKSNQYAGAVPGYYSGAYGSGTVGAAMSNMSYMGGGVGGFEYGGIARGPRSGYRTTLHGTEAVVPLPNGKAIPVEIQGRGGETHIHLHVDGREIGYAIISDDEVMDKIDYKLTKIHSRTYN